MNVLTVLVAGAGVTAAVVLRRKFGRGKVGLEDDKVAHSSQLIAAVRAREKEFDTPLFEDPLAEVLKGSFVLNVPKLARAISLRTRFFDDFAMQAVGGGSVKQVVLPAAGMDARPYRLPVESDVVFYEIDVPKVLDEKERLLAEAKTQFEPKSKLIRVRQDLADPKWPEALVSKEYNPAEPSVWLVEGLTYYLTEEQVVSLFKRMQGIMASGSTIVVSLLIERDGLASRGSFESHFKWHCSKPEEFFMGLGFTEIEDLAVGSEKVNYGVWYDTKPSMYHFVTMKMP